MAFVTRRGKELQQQIEKFVGISDEILEICSLVARHAATHRRLQEAQCNRELRPSEVRKERQIEERIRTLVGRLPPLPPLDSGKRIAVEFSGDPRGYTVKLVVPGDRGGNTWGLDGRYGV